MALTIGFRLGVYEVTAPIGEGGMGMVYRATDTSLDRQVAIKVLPDAFAQDAERLARFEREAKTLAALNHPHIAAIYGFERSSSTQALVMELVEGEDLSQRIARGAIPPDEALPIARQIADALEAAHEQGIIHRDLKPANIKVRADGTVKVLDFGLAKAAGPPEGGHYVQPGMSLSPTMMSPTMVSPAMMSAAGVILGTAAYMAPEQAKGRAVDKRADIWAFGVVVHEMLTGGHLFLADTIPETLAHVMTRQIDLGTMPAATPRRIRDLLARCLEKDPKKRLRDIGEARIQLEEVISGVADDLSSAAVGVATAPAVSHRRERVAWAVAVAAAVLLALVTGAAAWRLKPEPARGVARFAVPLPDGQDFTGTGRQVVALSPDGSTLVYVANTRLYVRPISALDARLLVGETGGQVTSPVVSPDGRSVAFYSAADSTLKRLDLAGGASVTITPADNPLGMSWSDEGLVFSQADTGILRVSPDGGVPEVIVPPSPDETKTLPQLLPGGQAVLMSVKPAAEGWDKGAVVVQPLGGGARTTVVAAGSYGRYIPTGHLVYAVNGVLMAVPFDADSLSVSGGPVPIVEGVRRDGLGTGQVGTAQFAVSASGTLAFLPGPAVGSSIGNLLGLVDRKGNLQPLAVPPGNYAAPRISPDGRFVAFEVEDSQEPSVWIYELAGRTAMRRLTFGKKNRAPIWSPDGQWVVFQSDREGDLAGFRQRADGTGVAERVTKPEAGEEHIPQSVSPDGKHLLFTVRKERTYTLRTTQVPARVGAKAEPFGGVRSEQGLVEGVFSPDGRWVAYQEPVPGSGGNPPVFLQPFPATGAKYLVRQQGGHPYWSPKGDQLILNVRAGQSVIVPVTTTPAVALGQEVNFPRTGRTEGAPQTSRRNSDSHPDGEHIVGITTTGAGQGTSRQITVVLNWFDELRARVPAP
jgi:serine/threonine-protein kinase